MKAARFGAFFLTALCMVGTSHASSQTGDYGANLIPNPGFDRIENGKPANWSAHGVKGCCVRDEREGVAGTGALTIAADQSANPLWESDPIPLDGSGGGAEFSAWMKLVNVRQGAQIWHKAGLRLNFYDRNGKLIKLFDLVRDEGTHDWTEIRNSVVIPAGAASAKAVFFLSKSTGKVWLDDVSLKLFPRHVGKRLSAVPGDAALTLTVDPRAVQHAPANLNGLLYENVKKRFAGVKELRPTLIRTPQIATYYFPVRDDQRGRVKYDWGSLDRDIRQIVDMGAVPFVSIGWVPEAFENEIRDRDYSRWNAFISALVARYSKQYDVSGWYWNLWNEPSVYREVGGKMRYVNWSGTEEEFYRFYSETARAAHAANEDVKIGAAGFAANSPWLFRFIDWCGANDVRLDFVSWHSYGTVPQLLGEKIRRVKTALGKFASTRQAETVIDEWSSYLEGGEERKSWLSSGSYAAAYRVAALEQMLASGLNANAWFNTYEKHFGVLADDRGQAVADTFRFVSSLGTRPVEISGHHQDPYISALAGVDEDGNAGVLVSYFKHWTDRTPEHSKRLRILVPRSGANAATLPKYRLYRIVAETSDRTTQRGAFADNVVAEPIAGDLRDGRLELDVTIEPNSVLLLKTDG